jgi:hypothetical protein
MRTMTPTLMYMDSSLSCVRRSVYPWIYERETTEVCSEVRAGIGQV